MSATGEIIWKLIISDGMSALVKVESETAGLKLNITLKKKPILRSWHPVPSLCGK